MPANWNDAALCDLIAQDLVEADWPRAINRALIQSAANGEKPYTDKEAEENQQRVNVSDLTLTRVLHEARAQMNAAFLGPGQFFTCKTDAVKTHDRSRINGIVTAEINRALKQSIEYFECMRAKGGNLILHGISPSVWENESTPIPTPIGVEDALIPSGTLLGFKNLPFIYFRRSWTAMELKKMVRTEKRDPGWNMDFVNRCLEWMDRELVQMSGANWPEGWSPEKWQEMEKEQGWAYSDRVPTLDVFDIYAYHESEKQSGWVRRIILDSWSNGGFTPPQASSKPERRRGRTDSKGHDIDTPDKDDFLFTTGDNPVYGKWNNFCSFQFADLSAVFPARYHSQRSLGWLLYAPCHLLNRMRCGFSQAVFESMMQYFRVKSADDMQRALKIELGNIGIIDDTISPIPASERWQPNAQFMELGMTNQQNLIDNNSKSWTQSVGGGNDRTEKTKFQVQAEVQQANALVGAAMSQAYAYQVYESREIVRRFMRKDTTDPMVRTFRADCLRQSVPEDVLEYEKWDVQQTRISGNGNQTLALLQATQLMEWRAALDPEPQRIVLRDAITSVTNDPYKGMELVPEKPEVSDSIHDSEQLFATLMLGIPCPPKSGLNAAEVAGAIIGMMEAMLRLLWPVGTPDKVMGLQNAAKYAAAYIQQLQGDDQAKPVAKMLGDKLGKLMNLVKAMAQRQQEMQKKAAAQNGNGQIDPETQGKVQSSLIQAQSKAKIAEATASQRLRHKEIGFRQKTAQGQAKQQADIAALDLKTAAEIRREQFKSMNEPDRSPEDSK